MGKERDLIPEGGKTLSTGHLLELTTWDRDHGKLYRARVTDKEGENLVFSLTFSAGELPVVVEAVKALAGHHKHATRACSTIADAWEDYSMEGRL